MLKIRRTWKCGDDGICFDNVFRSLVENMYPPKPGEVRQLYVFIASCVLDMLAQVMGPSQHTQHKYDLYSTQHTIVHDLCTTQHTTVHDLYTTQHITLHDQHHTTHHCT
jgi:hypothetical protein